MENHKFTIEELLGTLTSMGIHHTGTIQTASILLLEEITEAKFKDKKSQQECIKLAKILVQKSQKHYDLLETILKEWKKINDDKSL